MIAEILLTVVVILAIAAASFWWYKHRNSTINDFLPSNSADTTPAEANTPGITEPSPEEASPQP